MSLAKPLGLSLCNYCNLVVKDKNLLGLKLLQFAGTEKLVDKSYTVNIITLWSVDKFTCLFKPTLFGTWISLDIFGSYYSTPLTNNGIQI